MHDQVIPEGPHTSAANLGSGNGVVLAPPLWDGRQAYAVNSSRPNNTSISLLPQDDVQANSGSGDGAFPPPPLWDDRQASTDNSTRLNSTSTSLPPQDDVQANFGLGDGAFPPPPLWDDGQAFTDNSTRLNSASTSLPPQDDVRANSSSGDSSGDGASPAPPLQDAGQAFTVNSRLDDASSPSSPSSPRPASNNSLLRQTPSILRRPPCHSTATRSFDIPPSAKSTYEAVLMDASKWGQVWLDCVQSFVDFEKAAGFSSQDNRLPVSKFRPKELSDWFKSGRKTSGSGWTNFCIGDPSSFGFTWREW